MTTMTSDGGGCKDLELQVRLGEGMQWKGTGEVNELQHTRRRNEEMQRHFVFIPVGVPR